jgi:signal transduction histidine kinase/ActR/RegA family two-component response regulator
VLNSLLEGCQVVGFDYTYLYLNDTAVAQAKQPREALLGRTLMACYPGIDQTPMFSVLRRCIAERSHQRMEHEFEFPDGSLGWFELRFIPVPEGTCILSLDITQSKRAAATLARTEEQLRQAQKLEAVGRLTRGVAHDFNNALSVILSYAGLLAGDLRPGDPLRADLEEILKAGERAAELTRQLLAVSRQQVVQPRIVDLNDVIAQVESMIRRLVGADVEVRTLLGSGLGLVKTDPGQIEQVVMNLVVNAREAMPSGGVLTLETGNLELDEGYVAQHVGMTAGPHVMMAVSDTGLGMDKATQERIFEPSFTTKEGGKGTGLGLSTVFGIVRQSAGSVWVYSEVGKGTTFKVYLPCIDPLRRPVTPPAPVTTLAGGETVLLVEDDDQLRAVAVGILSRHGYRVLAAANAGEALLLWEKHEGAIALLLSDVVMPHLSGPELAQRLLRLRPELRVLFMSGYTPEAIMHHAVLDRGAEFLPKPITPQALLTRVRQVLDRRLSSSSS